MFRLAAALCLVASGAHGAQLEYVTPEFIDHSQSRVEKGRAMYEEGYLSAALVRNLDQSRKAEPSADAPHAFLQMNIKADRHDTFAKRTESQQRAYESHMQQQAREQQVFLAEQAHAYHTFAAQQHQQAAMSAMQQLHAMQAPFGMMAAPPGTRVLAPTAPSYDIYRNNPYSAFDIPQAAYQSPYVDASGQLRYGDSYTATAPAAPTWLPSVPFMPGKQPEA